MQLKHLLEKTFIAVSLFIFVVFSAYANPNTFEVREVTIPTQNAATGMITINFDAPFDVIPLVFSLATTRGANPCAARISNVTLTSFDVACVESSNDGPHAGMDIQYLAIAPGVHPIPTSTGGVITFEAGSIDTVTQQHNYDCTGADADVDIATDCVNEGFDTITPVTSFATTPTILGQVQTLNSETASPPGTNSEPFLTTAFDIDEGNLSTFGLALERSEDFDGAITTNESIAWLAVEQNTGCATLDFSSRGGPSAVNFESIVTGEVIDGWSDGVTTGEGASFTAGCFTTAPVVLANKRSRNEEDGGWLRQSVINTTEIRLTIDEDQESDGERNHADESASVVAFGPAFSTPVTMSKVAISATENTVDFSWQTATETFNIGFNLWGEFEGNWVRLNKRMIPSAARDKLTPSDYSESIIFKDKHRSQITRFGVSSLDVNGKEEFFGPFIDGEIYGEQAIPELINWQAIREQYTQRMQDRGFVFVNGRWVRPLVKGGSSEGEQWLNITTDQQGLYSLTFAEILASGLDWDDQRVNHIALSFKGKPVPRHIVSSDNRFNAGDRIEFLALPPQGEDALYVGEAVYQLKIDRRLALDMPVIDHVLSGDDIDDISDQISQQQLVWQRQGEQTFYTELSSSDPWMDAELFSYGSTVEKSYTFILSDQIIANSVGELHLSLAGGIDYPGIAPDHHLQVAVNDVTVFDGTSDGFVDWKINVSLDSGVLRVGDNAVKLTLPADTEYPVDIINIDFVALGAFEPLNWSATNNKALSFSAQDGMEAYQISTDDVSANFLASSSATAYIFDQAGNISRVTNLADRLVTNVDANLTSLILPALALQDQIEDVQYWLSSNAQMLTASNLNVVSSIDMLDVAADYLIITHSSFVGEDLDQYVNYKRSTGLNTKVVEMSDIINQFGFGMNTPDALRNYLVAENKENDFDYVLLVGGHSYDYLNYLNQGAVNFIPTWYRQVDLIQYAPTDTPFIELTADGRPDKAIGRWPVRTLNDLRNIIRKTIEWDNNQMFAERSALLIAEQKEGNFDYAQQLDSSVSSTVSKWNDVTRVYLDDVFTQEPIGTINDARKNIIDRINQGVGLTMFNGHGSPSSWTFQSLVSWQHLQELENHGKPTIVMPLACYTTYYETPSVNSLAHQWLFHSNSEESQGAVAIHGAMVLGEYRENAKFADKLLKQQLRRGKTLGQGILAVKRSLSPWNQMVNNWALLGDPTLRMGQ